MCNICLFNVHLKQYSMKTGKYKDTYNLLRSDYIYLILSLLGRWTKFFKTRPQAPGPHLTSPVASPAARWPAVPVSPTGLIWSTTWAIVIDAGADSWTGVFDVEALLGLLASTWHWKYRNNWFLRLFIHQFVIFFSSLLRTARVSSVCLNYEWYLCTMSCFQQLI